MPSTNDDKNLSALIDDCLNVLPGTTKRPWRWIDNEQNVRLERRLHKKRLTKRDGAWFMLLAGPPHPAVDDPDGFDHPRVISLRWDKIKGESVINGYPGYDDQKLMEQAVNMHEALMHAVQQVDRYARELQHEHREDDNHHGDKLAAMIAPVRDAIAALRPHQHHGKGEPR
jgi:hypothetical protein